MSKLFKKIKDKKMRTGFYNNEINVVCLKYLKEGSLNTMYMRYFFYYLWHFVWFKNLFFTKINNRCVFTNKARWVFSRFKLSRMSLKQSFLKGSILGMKFLLW